MQQQRTAFGYLIVLDPGDELVGSLIAFARQEDVDGAVCYGTGRVKELEIGIYDSASADYRRREYDEPLEVCSLNGTLALMDGEPLPQLHGLFARGDFSVVGGRVFQAVCASTLEVAVHTTPAPLLRSPADPNSLTGLRLELPA